MKRYDDDRMLPACYVRDDGTVLLEDETHAAYDAGDYTTETWRVAIDVEATIHRLTGIGGCELRKLTPEQRELLRAVFKEEARLAMLPVQLRPELAVLLAEMRRLDANGWCICTDGSMDDLTTERAIEALTETIENIKKG